MILEQITKANDIKKIDPKDYATLAQELRDFMIDKTSVNGGHIASNLGTVELTMALHLCLDLPKDKIIWDVGHQSYTHKILSGRKDAFDDLRKFGGISGFPKINESPCDAFNTGHSTTSISAALGLAQARNINGGDNTIVAVIGDGALTGGMAYEAMNNASQMKGNFIILLNDNEMSIGHNVGGISNYLSSIRTAEGYNNFKNNLASRLLSIPNVGEKIFYKLKRTKDSIKKLFVPGMFFEEMGITYLGPVDGHDVNALCKAIEAAKKLDHAVLIHAITKKGKGFAPAEKDPAKFHGVGPYDKVTGETAKKEYPDYTDVFSDELVKLAATNTKIVAVTAAMPDGTGLKKFAKAYPDRFFDVGIAEEHAVTSAAGMAAGGLIPVVAIYSSFLQRGFDQIIHDVCLQNLHVVFAIDRAGLVGADGETHQGVFDLSYLSCIPNMSVLAPKNDTELTQMLAYAVDYPGPIAIRYPRGTAYRSLQEFNAPIEFGKAEMLYEESDIAIIAAGSMVSTGKHIREKLKEEGKNCSLVNLRFVKPIDFEMIDRLAVKHKLIITMEENVLQGGFGLAVSDYAADKYPDVKVMHVSLPDAYVEHGDVSLLREKLGIDSASILKRLREADERTT